MAQAELTMIPQNYVDLTDPEAAKKFTRIIDLLWKKMMMYSRYITMQIFRMKHN